MSMSISIDGADELAAEMRQMADRYPDQCNAAMKKVAKDFRDEVNAQFPGSYAKGKRPFAKNWKTEYETSGFGLITETTVANKSPHWHLVENGHHKWYMGQDTGGFVPGKHYAERVRADFEKTYPDRMDAAVTAALRKAGLA